MLHILMLVDSVCPGEPCFVDPEEISTVQKVQGGGGGSSSGCQPFYHIPARRGHDVSF